MDEEEEKEKKGKREDKKSHQYSSRVIQLRGSRPRGQLVITIRVPTPCILPPEVDPCGPPMGSQFDLFLFYICP